MTRCELSSWKACDGFLQNQMKDRSILPRGTLDDSNSSVYEKLAIQGSDFDEGEPLTLCKVLDSKVDQPLRCDPINTAVFRAGFRTTTDTIDSLDKDNFESPLLPENPRRWQVESVLTNGKNLAECNRGRPGGPSFGVVTNLVTTHENGLRVQRRICPTALKDSNLFPSMIEGLRS